MSHTSTAVPHATAKPSSPTREAPAPEPEPEPGSSGARERTLSSGTLAPCSRAAPSAHCRTHSTSSSALRSQRVSTLSSPPVTALAWESNAKAAATTAPACCPR
eukprot:2789378-Rhodomonas_salina.1